MHTFRQEKNSEDEEIYEYSSEEFVLQSPRDAIGSSIYLFPGSAIREQGRNCRLNLNYPARYCTASAPPLCFGGTPLGKVNLRRAAPEGTVRLQKRLHLFRTKKKSCRVHRWHQSLVAARKVHISQPCWHPKGTPGHLHRYVLSIAASSATGHRGRRMPHFPQN